MLGCSNETSKKFYLEGLKDEEFVMNKTKEFFGGIVWKATKEQDIHWHCDFFWSPFEGSPYIKGFDVKGPKRSSRKDNDFNYSIVWLELQNKFGREGWLKGKADYIAFRSDKSIIYVEREKLLDWVIEKTGDKQLVYSNPSDMYIPYQRRGNYDIIVKSPISDMEMIAKHIIYIN